MVGGVLELHWQHEPWGENFLTAYDVLENGQRRFIDSWSGGPFDGVTEATPWLMRTLISAGVVPAR